MWAGREGWARDWGVPMGKRWVVLVAALVVVTAACGNATDGNGEAKGSSSGAGGPTGTASAADLQKKVPSTEVGVTDDAIRIGGVASKTNALGAPYDQAALGAQAFFDMVNSQGGIYGRKLELVANRDDQMVNNQAEIQGLISQDKVFAIAPVMSLLFTGADTAATEGIPTFGWNINQQWTGPPNLFGEKGSALCIDCAHPVQPWLSQKNGFKKIALLTYAVDQSKICAKGVTESFKKWPTAEIAYEDTSIPFGATDLSVTVQKMKDAGVDLVVTCMDTNGVTTLAKEMKRQGVNAPQYLQNGYDYDLLSKFGDLFEGSFVLTGFTPMEVSQPPKGLQDYFTWIDKTPGAKRGELSLAGWLSAALLYRGLVGAGPEFTRDKVVNAINQITDWDADGIITGVDWTRAHTSEGGDYCFAITKIEGSKFVPQYGEPGKPFLCLSPTDPNLNPNPTPQA